LHSEGKFHTFDGDVTGHAKDINIVHSESLASFVENFDHTHPIFLSIAEEVAKSRADELLRKFPKVVGAGSISPLTAWTANDEHMKTVEHIRNVHHDNPHAMVFMEMVSKRVLARIVDNRFCEVGALEQPAVTHIQNLKAGIESSINNLKWIFNAIRDKVSLMFKQVFGGFSEWINKELAKPAWVHMKASFTKIVNFCGINFGYVRRRIPLSYIMMKRANNNNTTTTTTTTHTHTHTHTGNSVSTDRYTQSEAPETHDNVSTIV
jgi:hypothetical protein